MGNVARIDLMESWQVYRAFLQSEDLEVVATSLATTSRKLSEQLSQYPELKRAADAAKADRLPACFQDLDDEAKKIWEILSGKDSPEDAKQQALLALANNGQRERQKLLAWGLMCNYFDVNGALKQLGIPVSQYRKWLKEPEFMSLIDAVQFSKRAFCEGQLMKLVAVGDSKAVLFANERLNKEDYGSRIEVSGKVEHQHTANLDLSRLPIELRVQVLEALQLSGAVDADGLLIETIDAPSVKRLG